MLQTHKPIPFELEWLWISIDIYFFVDTRQHIRFESQLACYGHFFHCWKIGKKYFLYSPLSSDAMSSRFLLSPQHQKRTILCVVFLNAILIWLIGDPLRNASGWPTRRCETRVCCRLSWKLILFAILIGCTANCALIAVN